MTLADTIVSVPRNHLCSTCSILLPSSRRRSLIFLLLPWFAFSRMSYNWNHTVYSLFRLALSFGHKRCIWAFWVALVVKNLPADAGDTRDAHVISGSRRSPREGKGKPLQYSCLENSWTEEPDGLPSIGSQRVRHN